MNVGSVCTRRVASIDSGGTLAEAAGLMPERHVGALVVTMQVPDGLDVRDIVTNRDLAIDVVARDSTPARSGSASW